MKRGKDEASRIETQVVTEEVAVTHEGMKPQEIFPQGAFSSQ